MTILVTGAAGFIGYHVSKRLLEQNHTVIGIDNMNDYYSPDLKFARLQQLGISRTAAEKNNHPTTSKDSPSLFTFIRMELQDRHHLPLIFEQFQIEAVCNLAAQAGVRYSLEHPEAYVDSNIVGFMNLLECCRNFNINHLVYASSSSVYGLNKEIPFSTSAKVDHPISIYAASKKSNELMAHTYSHLFELPTTGLRFFTVYGPWGRPDMAIYLFTEAISKNKPIKVFNQGNMERDFTFIDDIVTGVVKVLEAPLSERIQHSEFYKVYNIGNNNAVSLAHFISEIEKNLNKKAIKEMLPMQPGDVEKTWANVDSLIEDYDYRPSTPISEGIKKFVDWYKAYHSI
ncbi:NAD-dependent epimerase [Spongiimicrobium salis]|uniref:NAD-dependent epimerase n=1 Tax=Spongiimicrobium salis TaxID=1667022 RepID=UPI00374D4D0B